MEMRNMMKSTLLLAGAILSSTAWAQQDTLGAEAPLPEVAIVGRQAFSLPGAGQVINARKLALLNQPDLNKVLRTVPGVNIRDEEGFGLRPNIGMRGTQVNRSARVTVMEDGILIAPAPYADPAAYYFPTFARMEGVEVLKGSSQIKHGPYTIGGALNLLSTSIPNSFAGQALLSYGSFGTQQQRIWVGDSKAQFDYVFELNRMASNGFKQLDNGGNTGFDRRDLMAKLRWRSKEGAKVAQSVSLKLSSMTEDGDETYLGLTYDDFVANPLRRYAATQQDILDMNHHHVSLNHTIIPLKNLTISTTGYYTHTFRDWARANSAGGQSLNNILADPLTHAQPYRIMTGQADGDIVYQSAARTYTAKGIQTNARYKWATGAVQHNLQLGVRYHEDEADRWATRSTYAMRSGTMVLTQAGVLGNQENQVRSANSLATYLQYDLRYKGLTLSPGVRVERINLAIDNYGNADFARLGTALRSASNALTATMPGIGFNYELNPQMSAFGGVHKGFSPPGPPTTNTSNGQAMAETAMNYEAGYRYRNNIVLAQITGFVNQYSNLLGSDNLSGGGAGTGDMFNGGNARIKGIEASLEIDLMRNQGLEKGIRVPLSLAYTYTHAQFQKTFSNAGGDWGTGTIQAGDRIPFVTPHLLTALISYEAPRWNATLTGRYTGLTRVRPGQGDNIVTPAADTKYNDVNALEAYWVFDLSANYSIAPKVQLFTLINNLLNQDYIVANLPQGYRPGIPFAFNGGIKVSL